MFNPWVALTIQGSRLIWEAQSVVALRLIRLAGGGAAARAEARGMIAEKVAALSQAQAVVATAVLGGSSGPHAAGKVLRVYRKKVRANQRRLSK